jgi:hypothetical protein
MARTGIMTAKEVEQLPRSPAFIASIAVFTCRSRTALCRGWGAT